MPQFWQVSDTTIPYPPKLSWAFSRSWQDFRTQLNGETWMGDTLLGLIYFRTSMRMWIFVADRRFYSGWRGSSFFKQPFYDVGVVQAADANKQPFALMEIITLSPNVTPLGTNFTGPVMVWVTHSQWLKWATDIFGATRSSQANMTSYSVLDIAAVFSCQMHRRLSLTRKISKCTCSQILAMASIFLYVLIQFFLGHVLT